MIDGRAHDPPGVVRGILAAGPVPAPEFRKLARDRGIPVKAIKAACDAAGAVCRKLGRPGEGGWVWQLGRPLDDFIRTHAGRRGFYADNLFAGGKEVQCKLGDTIEEAREKVAAILAGRDADRKARPPRGGARPGAGNRKPAPDQLADLIRQFRSAGQADLARQVLKLSRAASQHPTRHRR